MDGTVSVRVAEPGDAEAIAAIYAPIVRHTAILFETEPPSRGPGSSTQTSSGFPQSAPRTAAKLEP